MKRFWILPTLLFAATACAPQGGYTLLGEVPEVWEGKSVVLYAVDGGSAEPLDSTTVSGGQFRLKGVLATPRRCRGVIYLDPNDRTSRDTRISFDVLLDSTQVTARYDAHQGQPAFTLSGGATQEAMQEFRREQAALSGAYDRLFDEYIATFYHRADRQNGIALARRLTQLNEQILSRKIDYIRSHPNSGVSLQLADEVVHNAAIPTRDTLTALIGMLAPDLRASAAGQRLATLARTKRMLCGGQLPDLTVIDPQGQKHSLSDLLLPGHCTLVEIWASWCSPCRNDIPYLREAYARYHDRGFDIVGISIDTQSDAWQQALTSEKMAWRQYNDPERESFEAFETSSVPTSILVDEQGRILQLKARGGWLGAALETRYDKQTK